MSRNAIRKKNTQEEKKRKKRRDIFFAARINIELTAKPALKSVAQLDHLGGPGVTFNEGASTLAQID